MADRYWLGVTSDWTDTANWSTTLTGVGGSAAPVSTDAVYILKGGLDINVNVSGHTAVDLNSLTIGGEFTGSIGNLGTALTIAVSGRTSINYSGSGQILITAGTNDIDDLHITRPGGSGSASVNLTGGRFTAIYAGRGVNLTMEAGATCTTFLSTGANVTIEYNSTAITTGSWYGGVVACRRTVTTGTVEGANFTMGYIGASTTLNLRKDARYTHNSVGTLAKVNSFPSSVGTAGSVAFTVTNSDVYQGATLFQNNPAVVTNTNDPVFYP